MLVKTRPNSIPIGCLIDNTSESDSKSNELKKSIRNGHDLYVNNLVGDVKANPTDFYRYINCQKKRYPRYYPFFKRGKEVKWSCPIRFRERK